MSVHTPIPTGSRTRETTRPAVRADERGSAVEPEFQLVDFDRYVVSLNGPVGYVEVVAPVFVCYLGHPYPMAEEIAQVHDFDRAVQVVSERAAVARRHKLAP